MPNWRWDLLIIQNCSYQTKYRINAFIIWQGCKCSFNVQRLLVLSAPQFRFSSINFHITGHMNILTLIIRYILKIKSRLISLQFYLGSMRRELNFIYVYYVYMPWVYIYLQIHEVRLRVCGDPFLHRSDTQVSMLIAKEAIRNSQDGREIINEIYIIIYSSDCAKRS